MSNNENDKLLDHEYDGIQELDNNLPLWWLWTFFGAIIFGFIYWLHYDFSGDGPSLDDELRQGMAVIEQQRNKAQESPSKEGEGPTLEELFAKGQTIYKMNCAACHLENGGGSIGPNLTDDYWLHGADEDSVKKVVEEGVLAKGMPPWKAILRPNDVKSVVAFVLSLKGKNVSGGKAPQGEKVN